LVKIIKKNIVIEYQQAQGGKNVLCAEMLQWEDPAHDKNSSNDL
jgi:hypothetical protein